MLQDECHFVSLRDVERTLSVMMWFYRTGEMLFKLMNEKIVKAKDPGLTINFDDHCRSLILALGVCYHACLENSKENPNRRSFRERIAKEFDSFSLRHGAKTILDEITM